MPTDCIWREPLSGLDKQCMGLGAAPGGHISAKECEAFCCAHRFGGGATDGVAGLLVDQPAKIGFCDVWQWVSAAQLPDTTYKYTCFIGVRPEDNGGAYSCGKNAPDLTSVRWEGGRDCAGLAPALWGDTVLLFVVVLGGLYFGLGTAYKRHTSGARGWAALPHAAFWLELRALVQDGMALARGAGGRENGQKGGRKADPAASREPLLTGSGRKHGESTGGKAGGSSSRKHSKSKRSAKKSSRAEGEGGAASPSPLAVAPAPAAATAPGTAAAAGGRWVHIPA